MTSTRTVLLLALVALPLRAEIVDRILAVVGNRVITWSDVVAEANYQAFLDSQEPVTPAKLLPREPREPKEPNPPKRPNSPKEPN